MQTPADVDRDLLQDAKSATGLETERAIVEAGLRLLVQLKNREGLRELRGKVTWEGDLEESRRSRFSCEEIESVVARRHAVIFDDQDLRIPEDAFSYEGFERWLDSGEFPETGRIDYLAGDVEIDMSPEDLYTHGIVKGAIHATLHKLIMGRLGDVYTDRARISSRFAGLSVEPDVVVVLFDTLKSGRVRYVPAAIQEPDRFSRMEGAPDLAVEVVSDGSQNKDLKRLPPFYAKTGIPEFWVADARGGKVRFQIHTLEEGKYVPVEADAEGWMPSPRLGLSFRLLRLQSPISTPYFVLEHRPG